MRACRLSAVVAVRRRWRPGCSAPSGGASSTSASRASRAAVDRAARLALRQLRRAGARRATTSRSCRTSCCAAAAAPASRRSRPATRWSRRWPRCSRRRCGGRSSPAIPGEAVGDPAGPLRRLLRVRGRAGRAVVHRPRDACCLPDVITLPAIPILFLSGFGAHDGRWLRAPDRRRGRLPVPAPHRRLLLLRAQARGAGPRRRQAAGASSARCWAGGRCRSWCCVGAGRRRR